MVGAALFVVGQAMIGIGAYVLSRTLAWSIVVGAVLLIEGAICVIACFVTEQSEGRPSKPWHDGA
jgi:uncharacterized membrane protein HdeD (DUF308 family)